MGLWSWRTLARNSLKSKVEVGERPPRGEVVNEASEATTDVLIKLISGELTETNDVAKARVGLFEATMFGAGSWVDSGRPTCEFDCGIAIR
jgi:hypothetical protein